MAAPSGLHVAVIGDAVPAGMPLEHAVPGDVLERRVQKTGAVKWCRRCGRKHGSRQDCGLTDAAVPASTGRMVERLVRR